MKAKKMMALLMSAACVTSMCAGAFTVEAAESTGEVLHMMTYVDPQSNDPAQEKIYEVYEKFTEDTGIEIEYEIVPWDESESKLVIANQSGAAPDIALVSSQKLASLVNAGALQPMDEYIDRDLNRDDFVEAVWNAGTYSGDMG